MRGNIAVVGDSASVIGFKAIGLKTACVETSSEVAGAVESLISEGCFVIFVTEHALEGAEDVLKKYSDSKTHAIIPIPGRFGKTGIGMRNLDSYVEHALGTNILDKVKEE